MARKLPIDVAAVEDVSSFGAGVEHRPGSDIRPLLPQQILRFVLVDTLGCKDLGRSDKTAWEIPFLFRGCLAIVSFRKFGVRIAVYQPVGVDLDTSQIAADLTRSLVEAVKYCERHVFSDYIRQQVDGGRVTVRNQKGHLRGMYQYFREMVIRIQEGNGSLEDLPSSRNALFAVRFESFFNTVGMVNAYFSYLEHILVLMLPFSDFDLSTDDIGSFLRLKWRDKYKRILGTNSDGPAARHYETLHEVAEHYRNVHAHGGFNKLSAGGLAVHTPSGALEADFTLHKGRPLYSLLPIEFADYENICKAFDQVDAFLGQYYGARWAQAGLDVSFDEDSLALYVEASASEENFVRALERQSYIADMHANMDW